MSSKNAFNHFLTKGYPVDQCPYNTYDCLESNEDMESLFSVLLNFRDGNQNHPCFTANHVVANPDFNRIRESAFSQYYFEPFYDTLKRYPNHNKVLGYYRQGIEQGIFVPQFHGREHVNTPRWIKALQQNESDVHEAFNYEMFSVHAKRNPSYKMEYMDAFDLDFKEQLPSVNSMISVGLQMFRETFGYSSNSVIAPCYIWHSDIEETLKRNNVKYIQGNFYQQQPRIHNSGGGYQVKYHYTGQCNKYDQLFMVRNVFFEPALDRKKDWVDIALNRIDLAFRWNTPAIIQSHRLNYIGSIVHTNRDTSLKALNELLKKITQIWPDATFMSSDQLGNTLAGK